MLEWLVAIAMFVGLVAPLPWLLRRTKAARPKGIGSGVMVGIGLVFAMVFDPKAAQATEEIDRKHGESEDAESGQKP